MNLNIPQARIQMSVFIDVLRSALEDLPERPGSFLKHLRVLPEYLTQAIVAPNNFV